MFPRAKNPRATRLNYSLHKETVRRLRKYEREHRLKRNISETIKHALDEIEHLRTELAKYTPQ